MSYQQVIVESYESYPPPGYATPYSPPPPSYEGYPPPPGYQGYFNDGPPPPPEYQQEQDDSGCCSFLKGWYIDECLCFAYFVYTVWLRFVVAACWRSVAAAFRRARFASISNGACFRRVVCYLL
ncbi:hypothetical protein BVC80_9101g174 [Macleaya cordata]|uniref:Cysteine-rich transmembrane CYSTM domain-containing protein n=1 Tax=Macleaya cordata TaxID=56857 RepID=A0A200QGU9_MACCD|nr:hypothetical protein BVC80_9101g174 [Macleaya cordata]